MYSKLPSKHSRSSANLTFQPSNSRATGPSSPAAVGAALPAPAGEPVDPTAQPSADAGALANVGGRSSTYRSAQFAKQFLDDVFRGLDMSWLPGWQGRNTQIAHENTAKKKETDLSQYISENMFACKKYAEELKKHPLISKRYSDPTRKAMRDAYNFMREQRKLAEPNISDEKAKEVRRNCDACIDAVELLLGGFDTLEGVMTSTRTPEEKLEQKETVEWAVDAANRIAKMVQLFNNFPELTALSCASANIAIEGAIAVAVQTEIPALEDVRSALRDFHAGRMPASQHVENVLKAVVDALSAGGQGQAVLAFMKSSSGTSARPRAPQPEPPTALEATSKPG
jgi:hypothetical protein